MLENILKNYVVNTGIVSEFSFYNYKKIRYFDVLSHSRFSCIVKYSGMKYYVVLKNDVLVIELF